MISKPWLAALMALGSCTNPFPEEEEATLTIDVPADSASLAWPRDGSGARMYLSDALTDQRGLAGLSLQVADTAFSASDFEDGNKPVFVVPDIGNMIFSVQLMQDGRTVAEGSGSWKLEPSAEWVLEVNRAPYPPSEGFGGMEDFTNPRCHWFPVDPRARIRHTRPILRMPAGASSTAKPCATRARTARRTFSGWQPRKLVHCRRVKTPPWRQASAIHSARRPVQPKASRAFSRPLRWAISAVARG